MMHMNPEAEPAILLLTNRRTPLDVMIGSGIVDETGPANIGVDGDYVVTISRETEGLVVQVWSAIYPIVEAEDLIAEIRTLDAELPDEWNPGGRW